MAYQIEFQDSARYEADAILNYLKSKDEQSADNFYKDLQKCCVQLREGIVDYALSRFVTLAKQGYHSVFFNNYVVLYFQEGDKRTIAHIFHQSQDYASLV